VTAPEFAPSPTLYPFASRWFTGRAGRMHYLDEGGGQPILMLHGNPTWSFLYRHLIPALRGRFRCIAVDLLGFGRSERPAGFGYTPAEHTAVLGELIRHLNLTDLIVMGHDWGGPIGLSAAVAHRDRVAGLVLGSTWFWPPGWTLRTFGTVMSTRQMRRRVLERNFFVERILFGTVARRLSEPEKDHYRGVQPSPQLRVGVAEFPRQILASTPWLAELDRGVRTHLSATRALCTYPMRDLALPARTYLSRFRDTFTDLHVVRLPGAGHYFLEDDSPRVARAITDRFGGT
jgi:haloalkane dehalogenase